MDLVIAALDVGGTSIKSGVVRFATSEATTTSPMAAIEIGPSLPTLAQSDAESILARLAAMAQHALDLDPDAAGLAIAFCGPFDLDAGESRMRGVHKFEDIYGIDLRADLRHRTSIADRPIRFARDAESAGTGEALIGAGAGVDRALTVTLGTGMGTCLTDHARPVEYVGDLGVEHLAMRETQWGGRADDVLSARGLAVSLGIPMSDLRDAVEDDDNAAIVTEHGHRIGTFLAPVVDEFGAEIVVIGGAVSAAFDRLGPTLQSALGPTPVRAAALGPAGPLLGAAHLTFGS